MVEVEEVLVPGREWHLVRIWSAKPGYRGEADARVVVTGVGCGKGEGGEREGGAWARTGHCSLW